MFSYAMFNITHYKNVLSSFLVSKEGAWIITAGVLLCIGEVFENMSFVSHHVLLEELSELSGYVLIMLVSFTYSRNSTTRRSSGYSKSLILLHAQKARPIPHLDPALRARLQSALQRPDLKPTTRAKIEAALKQPETDAPRDFRQLLPRRPSSGLSHRGQAP